MTKWILRALGLFGLAALVAGTSGGGSAPVSLNIGDLTALAKPNEKAAPHVRSRDPSSVYAVVLHQMAFSRGNDPHKYLGTTAHYIILPDGGIYQLYGHDVRLPAANGFNTGSVSVEFAGNFPKNSRSTDPDDYWYPEKHHHDPAYQNQLTAAQAMSGRKLLKHLNENGFTHVLAHRQSGNDRGNDPGPDIWGAVGEYGVRDLGMADGGPGFKVGNGKPIPQAWRDTYGSWANVA